ncbi:MAG: SapC family protein [Magnetococcales bacterium]|nr:SapC family protein [Magnetococcales bacterium]
MAQSIFYDKPVPLNKEAHKDLKIGPNEGGFSFAKNTNSVLLSGMEFANAAKEYPIIFIKAGKSILPIALLGFRTDENLFIDDDGKWDAKYIPAFVRRYPFILSEAPGSGDKDGAKELTVCIDEDFPGLSTEEGSPLFDEDGNQTELLKNAISFLQEYQSQYQRTEIFVNRLKELDLLTGYTANAELADGEKISMGGLFVVDEKKLMELEKKKAMELFRSGELSWVYAHLLSLSNMNAVISRMVPKKAEDAE